MSLILSLGYRIPQNKREAQSAFGYSISCKENSFTWFSYHKSTKTLEYRDDLPHWQETRRGHLRLCCRSAALGLVFGDTWAARADKIRAQKPLKRLLLDIRLGFRYVSFQLGVEGFVLRYWGVDGRDAESQARSS